jgi:hypothetical protein
MKQLLLFFLLLPVLLFGQSQHMRISHNIRIQGKTITRNTSYPPVAQLADGTYNAFGTLIKIGDKLFHFFRSGTDHLTAGSVVVREYDILTGFWTAKRTVFDDATYDLRCASAGVIGSNIFVFTGRFNTATSTFVDIGYVKSTDLTGTSWGSYTILPSTLDAPLPMGRTIAASEASTHFQPWYEVELDASQFKINLYKTVDDGANWTTVNVYTGTAQYAEPCLERLDADNYLILARENNGSKLRMFYSTDKCATWTDGGNTNLPLVGSATFGNMADMLLDNGNLIVAMMDRNSGNIQLSINANPTWTFLNPTSFRTPSTYFINASLLGYPSVCAIQNGLYYILWGKEPNPLDTPPTEAYIMGCMDAFSAFFP